jgi:hypothetical protein
VGTAGEPDVIAQAQHLFQPVREQRSDFSSLCLPDFFDSAVFGFQIFSLHLGSCTACVPTYLEIGQQASDQNPQSRTDSNHPFQHGIHHRTTRQERKKHFVANGRSAFHSKNNKSYPKADYHNTEQQT